VKSLVCLVRPVLPRTFFVAHMGYAHGHIFFLSSPGPASLLSGILISTLIFGLGTSTGLVAGGSPLWRRGRDGSGVSNGREPFMISPKLHCGNALIAATRRILAGAMGVKVFTRECIGKIPPFFIPVVFKYSP